MVERHERPSDDLQEKIDDYIDTLRSRMELQKEEDVLRREVISGMQEAGLERVSIDDETKWLVLETPGNVKLKIKKSEDD